MPWLTDRRLAAVHAAMVARDGLAVLLAGPSGSGKSTAAAACALEGFDVLGDESIALEPHEKLVYGHCMHAAIKIRLEGLRRLTGIRDHIGQSSDDQAVVFLREAFPEQVAPSARVGAIALLELTDEPESRFQWIGGAEALRVLIGCLLAIDSVDAADRARAFQTVAAALELLPV